MDDESASEYLLEGLPGDEHDHLLEVLDTAHDVSVREQESEDQIVDLDRHERQQAAWERLYFWPP